ncbi:hypothetical protein LCGC14_0375150 [marine sediment metagenome]|uniref:Uncharacterized protein n=1 Tax=marine sediment metagenome TaxID=412755 RepID=A0A0F9WCN5_9ZZZZ
MRKEEREHCAEILKQNVDIGVHDATRLLNYTDALEAAAIKMWQHITEQKQIAPYESVEIREVMKVALPPGEV